MPRLKWSAIGERFYESGIDRGVLYLPNQVGVPWVGLVSVVESPSGGEPKAYYLDGIKYLNISSAEEFEATINAFGSPKEFSVCNGDSIIQNGLFVTGQPRKSFGLSYRTRIGNDTSGSEYGYKIHLVYNALAEPSNRSNNTIADSVNISTFSWRISTKPPIISGYKPTAHFVIDSRYTTFEVLAEVSDILYGSDELQPRLIEATELIDIFSRLYNDYQFDTTPLNGGIPSSTYSLSIDGGAPSETLIEFLEGGSP